LLREIKQKKIMSDSEYESGEINESMTIIHSCIEQLSHSSKVIYAKALKINTLIENPDLDIWAEEFLLHERAYKWAKHHMVPRKCSLWQIHKTLLESAKRDKRIARGSMVKLLKEEAEIMDLTEQQVSAWTILGRLPRFFL
jgi:hypothetical protein